MRDHAWWLEEYALFRAIHARTRERPWMKWARPLRQRKPAALDRARRELAREVLFWQYLQWIAGSQWEHARAEAHGIELFGDLPFMVDSDSADVWARQDEFRLDMSVGAPPDAFSATGQDWGVPLYRWDVIQSRGFEWLHQRARRCADLYDGYRIDHVVGFYRTYSRPRRGGEGFFTPANQGDQEILGEQVLGVMRATGSQIIAEDLGTVPEFVRASLARLDVPGFKVLRWEREWPEPGQPFRDPSDYPPLSVATSGTHDTEPLVVWWEGASEDDRQQVSALPTIQRLTGGAGILGSSGSRVRDVVLEALFASRSDLLLLPVQDVFGLRDRINDPATSSKLNWMFRLPWPCDRMDEIPEARERQATLRRWAAEYRRLG
jgi:4-alpha-glucanotransferase